MRLLAHALCERGGEGNVPNPISFLQLITVQEFHLPVQRMDELPPLALHAEVVSCHRAETAGVGPRRNILVDEVLDGVEQSAIGVVDEDQFVAHALEDELNTSILTQSLLL